MQELIEKIAAMNIQFNTLEATFNSWKDNAGTITKIVEVIKEVPVEVIREVEKIVEPDTSDLEAKVALLTGKLGDINGAMLGLTSVAPIVDKVADVVGEAVIATNEAVDASPATDTFVATEPAITELTVEEIKAEEAPIVAEEAPIV